LIDLNDMRLFAKVAETQGISAAARALGIPKSRVSRRVAAIEAALGTGLLERSARAVQLTEAGEILFQHCRRIVEEAGLAVEAINQLRDSPRGLLRVSVSVGVGQYLIAPYLGDFLKLYPDVNVQMDLNNRRVDLIAEGYDLVIRVGDLEDSSLLSRKIGHARAHLCAAPSYVEACGRLSSPEQLVDHQTLVMSNSNNTTRWVLENTSGETRSVEISPKTSVNDFTVLRAMVEAGSGIAIMPEYFIREAVEDKKLVRLLPDWRSPIINYYVLYPSRKGLTKKSEAFIDFFSKNMMKKTRP
jgi:DNA-binding transcriptional LysR family regulator